MSILARRILVPAAVALLAVGTYLALSGHGGVPTGAWLEANPVGAVGLALATGFADGLNPCAITTLLLFVGALLGLAASAASVGDERAARRRIWPVALAYVAGIFGLYFALGVGFLEIAQIQALGNAHVFTRVAGLIAVALGAAMVLDAVDPASPLKIGMPSFLHGAARRWGRRTSVSGAFLGGVLIGTCTIPCGGAMYLAVAAVIAGLSNEAFAYALLTSYNVAFVAPLILLVAITSSRDVLTRVSRLHVTHRGAVKGGLGLFVVAIGLFALL